jgi:hypothetical protein
MCGLRDYMGKDKAKHLWQISSFFVGKTSIFSAKSALFRTFCRVLKLEAN